MLGVLGDLVEDIVLWLDGPVHPATDNNVTMHRTRGGSAANVAAFAARHYPTRFVGCVGTDTIGKALVDELTSHGVDVAVQRRESTGTVVVLIDADGERTMFPHRGAATLLADVAEEYTGDLTHLHLPAYSFTGEPINSTSRKLVRRVHHQGATVSVDTSSTSILRSHGQQPFLRLLCELRPRYVLANRAEADFLGFLSNDEPGPALRQLGDTITVVKDGARPTIAFRPDAQPVRVPVPPVDDVRDLTGAGDAFAAGFLTAVLDTTVYAESELRAACAAGHRSAARVLGSAGATMGNG